MCTATLVDVQFIEDLFFRSNRNLPAIEIQALTGLCTFKATQFPLISTPFIRDCFATFETTDWNDHYTLLQGAYMDNFRLSALRIFSQSEYPYVIQKCPLF